MSLRGDTPEPPATTGGDTRTLSHADRARSSCAQVTHIDGRSPARSIARACSAVTNGDGYQVWRLRVRTSAPQCGHGEGVPERSLNLAPQPRQVGSTVRLQSRHQTAPSTTHAGSRVGMPRSHFAQVVATASPPCPMLSALLGPVNLEFRQSSNVGERILASSIRKPRVG